MIRRRFALFTLAVTCVAVFGAVHFSKTGSPPAEARTTEVGALVQAPSASVWMSDVEDGERKRSLPADISEIWAVVDFEDAADDRFQVELQDLAGNTVVNENFPPVSGTDRESISITISMFVGSYLSAISEILAPTPGVGDSAMGLGETVEFVQTMCGVRPDLPDPWPPVLPTPNPPNPTPTAAPPDSGARQGGRADGRRRVGSLPDRIATVARLGTEEYGLTVGIHAHAAGFIDFEPELERLLSEVDEGILKICFDTGHHSYAGFDPSPSWIAIWTEFPSYPGMANPKLKISTLLQAIDGCGNSSEKVDLDQKGRAASRSRRMPRRPPNEASRLPFKQQQFHREHQSGNRRAENCRHAGCGTSDQQRFTFSRTHMKNWANKEPIAPPVMMIGPSAPNGPPARSKSLRTAALGAQPWATSGCHQSRWPLSLREYRGRGFFQNQSVPSSL